MKSLFATLIFICFLWQSMSAQRYDNTWYLGYPGNGEIYGPSKITFDNGSFHAQKDTNFFRGFYDNNVVISDDNGNFFAAFTGLRINDSSGKIMKNGDSLWFETLPYLFGYCDDDIPQGGMFLPWPNHPDSILLFYTSQGNAAWPVTIELASLNLFYATLLKSGNNGKGSVIERRHEIINDTIQYGRLTAVKHANGRDWWILINEVYSNRFYRLLLDPSGVHKLDSQLVSLPIIDGLGQAAFSPDGNFYVVKNSVGLNIGNSIDIFHFDRCTGFLSNQHQIHKENTFLGGVAFSPNSRYLYVSFTTEIYQYDLSSNNIDSSKVLIGIYESPPIGFPGTFYTMQLAPDNKIYICATNGVKYLHVIHNPDEYGINCQFEQRGIVLPTHNFASLSYSPYFRLGPLDNSICDTLGLNNHPVAWYRYQQDTLVFLDVIFNDLSYYEPTTWSWDFGDGMISSSERNPTHQFNSAGVYQVCLTVGNTNSSNTYCKTLYLGVSATENPVLQNQIMVSPNPFFDHLTIILSTSLPSPVLTLYDSMGRLKRKEHLTFGITEIETSSLSPGMYFWEITSSGEKIKSGKTIKIRK